MGSQEPSPPIKSESPARNCTITVVSDHAVLGLIIAMISLTYHWNELHPQRWHPSSLAGHVCHSSEILKSPPMLKMNSKGSTQIMKQNISI